MLKRTILQNGVVKRTKKGGYFAPFSPKWGSKGASWGRKSDNIFVFFLLEANLEWIEMAFETVQNAPQNPFLGDFDAFRFGYGVFSLQFWGLLAP